MSKKAKKKYQLIIQAQTGDREQTEKISEVLGAVMDNRGLNPMILTLPAKVSILDIWRDKNDKKAWSGGNNR